MSRRSSGTEVSRTPDEIKGVHFTSLFMAVNAKVAYFIKWAKNGIISGCGDSDKRFARGGFLGRRWFFRGAWSQPPFFCPNQA